MQPNLKHTDEIWKKVPTELANNHNNVYASQYGRIKIDDNIIEGKKK